MLYVMKKNKQNLEKDGRGGGGGGRWRGGRGKTTLCVKRILLVKKHNILEIYFKFP